MAELEKMLGSFMSSPENMEKIMDVVKMLGGSGSEPPSDKEETLSVPIDDGPPKGVEPEMFSKVIDLLREYNADNDRRIRLLGALRPYIKKEDEMHIDRAIRIVKLSHVARNVLGGFLKQDGGGENV